MFLYILYNIVKLKYNVDVKNNNHKKKKGFEISKYNDVYSINTVIICIIRK